MCKFFRINKNTVLKSGIYQSVSSSKENTLGKHVYIYFKHYQKNQSKLVLVETLNLREF